MKKTLVAMMTAITISTSAQASLDAKFWPASDKARQFVKDTVVIGMLASPYGVGWSKNEQLLDYFKEARAAGITGHDITLAAASQNWDTFLQQHQKHRNAKLSASPKN